MGEEATRKSREGERDVGKSGGSFEGFTGGNGGDVDGRKVGTCHDVGRQWLLGVYEKVEAKP